MTKNVLSDFYNSEPAAARFMCYVEFVCWDIRLVRGGVPKQTTVRKTTIIHRFFVSFLDECVVWKMICFRKSICTMNRIGWLDFRIVL